MSRDLLPFADPRLAYRPCRADGLDRNLRVLPPVDYAHLIGHKGLVIPCDYPECHDCAPRREVTR
jgi:hypothetical protein